MPAFLSQYWVYTVRACISVPILGLHCPRLHFCPNIGSTLSTPAFLSQYFYIVPACISVPLFLHCPCLHFCPIIFTYPCLHFCPNIFTLSLPALLSKYFYIVPACISVPIFLHCPCLHFCPNIGSTLSVPAFLSQYLRHEVLLSPIPVTYRYFLFVHLFAPRMGGCTVW